jgi:hypothetical protein
MATHDDDIVNEMRKRVVELKNGVVIRDEARALYTSAIPVVGQSRRLKDASGRDEAGRALPDILPSASSEMYSTNRTDTTNRSGEGPQ